MRKVALFALAFAAPLTARAELEMRVGGESTMVTQNRFPEPTGHPLGMIWGTHSVTDYWPAATNVMLSYRLPGAMVAVDLEIAEQFILVSNFSGRVGTVLRPGVRVSPLPIPLYLRAAIPINVETANDTRELFDLRVGLGVTVPVKLFDLFLETDAEFPLGVGTNVPNAFQNWSILLSAGAQFRF